MARKETWRCCCWTILQNKYEMLHLVKGMIVALLNPPRRILPDKLSDILSDYQIYYFSLQFVQINLVETAELECPNVSNKKHFNLYKRQVHLCVCPSEYVSACLSLPPAFCTSRGVGDALEVNVYHKHDVKPGIRPSFSQLCGCQFQKCQICFLALVEDPSGGCDRRWKHKQGISASALSPEQRGKWHFLHFSAEPK